jgi:uncharacterized membrane protein YqgA involved in biofilm formation
MEFFKIFAGILVNSLAIVMGGVLGFFLKKRLKANVNNELNNLLMSIMGIIVVVLGLSDASRMKSPVLVITSLSLGALIGHVMHLDLLIDKLSHSLNKDSKSSFHEGFITSTALFCIGAMTILGAVQSGTGSGHSILFTKSVIDGISACVLAATLGFGVLFSSISTFLYTSIFILISYWFGDLFIGDLLIDFSAVGGVILIAIGLSSLLKIKEIKAINILPSLIIIIILHALMNLFIL